MQIQKIVNFIAGQAHHDNDMAVISGNAAEQAGKYGGYSMSVKDPRFRALNSL
jgi:hypothetical protein